MRLEERIEKIEKEIRETPYHKATEHHIGQLRAKLAKLRKRFKESQKSRGGVGFAVKKTGDATVVLVGPPSVGKSTLINKLTRAFSKTGAYDFTTLEVIPGMLEYKGAKIQILDIPGLIGGAAKGRGRGKEVLSVIRNADLLILMIDVENLFSLPEIKKELAGAEIKVIPKIVVVNKTDLLPRSHRHAEFISASYKIPKQVRNDIGKAIFISAQKRIGLEELKEAIWQKLELIRVYLKPKGKKPDFAQSLILKKGMTVFNATEKISSDLAENLKSAQVWGSSVKFPGQYVSLSHQLEDEDILFLIKK